MSNQTRRTPGPREQFGNPDSILSDPSNKETGNSEATAERFDQLDSLVSDFFEEVSALYSELGDSQKGVAPQVAESCSTAATTPGSSALSEDSSDKTRLLSQDRPIQDEKIKGATTDSFSSIPDSPPHSDDERESLNAALAQVIDDLERLETSERDSGLLEPGRRSAPKKSTISVVSRGINTQGMQSPSAPAEAYNPQKGEQEEGPALRFTAPVDSEPDSTSGAATGQSLFSQNRAKREFLSGCLVLVLMSAIGLGTFFFVTSKTTATNKETAQGNVSPSETKPSGKQLVGSRRVADGSKTGTSCLPSTNCPKENGTVTGEVSASVVFSNPTR